MEREAAREEANPVPGEEQASAQVLHLQRKPGLNPLWWTVGHVAYTLQSVVAEPMGLPDLSPLVFGRGSDGGDGYAAWELFDSMRVTWEERWSLDQSAYPDPRSYLAATHAQLAAVARATASAASPSDSPCSEPLPLVPPAVTYLILYAMIHELWHIEDIVHSRHSLELPPPPAVEVLG